MVVAILGTTISPYLFFWQASQEVEETRRIAARKPLVRAPEQGPRELERIRVDTYIGMALSNLVGLAIMVTTAATLHVAGVKDIETSTQAAGARPQAQAGEGILHHDCARHPDRRADQFLADQSDPCAVLERRDQRRRGGARDGDHDDDDS